MRRGPNGDAILGGLHLADLLREGSPLGPIETPAYIYDLDAIEAEARELDAAFGAHPHLVAFAVKANSAGPIISRLARAGAGADVVSGAELSLVTGLGIEPSAVVFSGVAKTDRELDQAITAGGRGILAVQAESVEELPRIEARARALGRRARVSLRINPGIEADTHAYIATGHDEAKFGILRADVGSAVEAVLASENVQLVGVGNHIGSQLTSTEDYLAAARMLIPVFAACEAAMLQAGRPPLELLDCGGGFGIDYGARPGEPSLGPPPRPADFVRALVRDVERAGLERVRLVVEPGRALVGPHGVLCASVIMQKRGRAEGKERRWLMIDAGMNDLIRPALYQAFHRIEPLAATAGETATFRVVGPVCESSDDFGGHDLPDPPPQHVVIRDAGAYGFTMASQYNGRALPLEVFVSNGRVDAMLRAADCSAWIRTRIAG
ncbi:MAG: diaminopimelate decarboxylase [Polyangiaceae bacterium]|nr:diaminopimelate decarboxylase [Polyangiaceae bacterium]MBK8941702.1 diaminopimelate decarboxylase [Polyangiaceae bacterium]